jgi:opacity protein-like surface antigen
MKRLFLGITATLVIVSGPALSADLRASLYKAPPPAPISTWTGCYAGGTIGGAAAHSDVTWTPAPPPGFQPVVGGAIAGETAASMSSTAFTGGGEVGCNYQYNGQLVLGVEGDFESNRVSASNAGVLHVRPPSCTPAAVLKLRDEAPICSSERLSSRQRAPSRASMSCCTMHPNVGMMEADWDGLEQVLRGCARVTDEECAYLKKAFVATERMWAENVAKVATVRLVMLAEAPQFGPDERYFYNTTTPFSSFFYFQDAEAILGRDFAKGHTGKRFLLQELARAGFIILDLFPFALNKDDTPSITYKMSARRYQELFQRTAGRYFDRKRDQILQRIFLRAGTALRAEHLA